MSTQLNHSSRRQGSGERQQQRKALKHRNWPESIGVLQDSNFRVEKGVNTLSEQPVLPAMMLKGSSQQGLAARGSSKMSMAVPRACGRVGGRRTAVRCTAALSAFSGQRLMARPAVARRAAPGRGRALNCKAM